MVEMHLTNLCRAMLKSQQTISKSALPDNLQYLVMYVLGLLKQPYMAPVKAVAGNEALDWMNYLRYIVNSMSPEETLPMFNPQIINIHNYSLAEFPSLEPLDRSLLKPDSLYLCFNGLSLSIYVGS